MHCCTTGSPQHEHRDHAGNSCSWDRSPVRKTDRDTIKDNSFIITNITCKHTVTKSAWQELTIILDFVLFNDSWSESKDFRCYV